MTLEFCGATVASSSRFGAAAARRCFEPAGHGGRHREYPYLAHLALVAPKVKAKIVRDATMTTGASWKSKDAGPNRILRWAMLLTDEELLELGLDMSALREVVVAKLRQKAACYEDCMEVARKLAWLAYGMSNAPTAPDEIRLYLEALFGAIVAGSTTCLVCRGPIDFKSFAEARRGRATIESAHSNPRSHTAANVGFAHRSCNIAQGEKTLDDFYDWIEEILERAGRRHAG
jgi:DraIII